MNDWTLLPDPDEPGRPAAADEPPTEPNKDCLGIAGGKRINADGSSSPCERGVGPGRQ